MDKNIEKYSPVTEATFYIMTALVNPMHGYAIMQTVEEMSNGRVVLAAGTLYGAIKNLLKDEIIVRDIANSSGRKKVYVLSEKGIKLLEYEAMRLKEMYQNAKKVLEG